MAKSILKSFKLPYVFRVTFGWLLLISGIIVMPLPIPTGLIMIVIGLALLARDSRFFRRQITNLRIRFPSFSQKLNDLAPKAGKLVGWLIRKTNPKKMAKKRIKNTESLN